MLVLGSAGAAGVGPPETDPAPRGAPVKGDGIDLLVGRLTPAASLFKEGETYEVRHGVWAAKEAPAARLETTTAHLMDSVSSSNEGAAEVCRQWLADIRAAAPGPHHRDPWEVAAEALPELVRRLGA